MLKIQKDDVIEIYDLIIETTGGRKGIRDEGLLDSAINSAYQTFAGQEIFPTVEEKAARMGYGLVANHAFLDGNKRIGMLIMLSFLEVHEIDLDYSDEDIINIGVSLASGKAEYEDLLKWINSHRVKTKQSDLDYSL